MKETKIITKRIEIPQAGVHIHYISNFFDLFGKIKNGK